jgi:hypothetical protein
VVQRMASTCAEWPHRRLLSEDRTAQRYRTPDAGWLYWSRAQQHPDRPCAAPSPARLPPGLPRLEGPEQPTPANASTSSCRSPRTWRLENYQTSPAAPHHAGPDSFQPRFANQHALSQILLTRQKRPPQQRAPARRSRQALRSHACRNTSRRRGQGLDGAGQGDRRPVSERTLPRRPASHGR